MSQFGFFLQGRLSLKGKDFLDYLWSKQQQGYVCMVYKPRPDEWLDFYVKTPVNWRGVAELPTDGDLYFCPNVFTSKSRRKEVVLPSRVMYQDLDEVTPLECPIFPTMWWETSPG